MTRPIYRSAVNSLPKEITQGNLGLWHDKFYDGWSEHPSDKDSWQTKAPQKIAWIQRIVGGPKPREKRAPKSGPGFGTQDLVAELVTRQKNLIEAGHGRLWVFSTVSEFVTGLGQSHPMENGFAWHYLLGEPYIPGTSVKGAVKSYAKWKSDDDENCAQAVDHLIWFDALPLNSVTLQGEIITPHYGEYYAKGLPPSDDSAPNPIPYLTVAKSQDFLFSALGSSEDLDLAEILMEEALQWFGIGAKTSTGYGRFVRHVTIESAWKDALACEQEAREREERLAKLSPWEREMLEDGFDSNEDRFMQAIKRKWLDRMEDSNGDGDQGYRIALKLKEWFDDHRTSSNRRPSPKTQEKLLRIEHVIANHANHR